MSNTATTKTAAEIAFRKLSGKRGATAAALQTATAWARKPSSYDLNRMAARWGVTLVSETNKSGVPVYRFA